MNEYLDMWRHYADFSGRTTVRGYWMAFLFNWLATMVLSIFARIIPVLGILSYIYTLAVLIPSLAIAVRRLRDGGNGWGWIFINFVPLVGFIIYIVKLCKASVPEQNPVHNYNQQNYNQW